MDSSPPTNPSENTSIQEIASQLPRVVRKVDDLTETDLTEIVQYMQRATHVCLGEAVELGSSVVIETDDIDGFLEELAARIEGTR